MLISQIVANVHTGLDAARHASFRFLSDALQLVYMRGLMLPSLNHAPPPPRPQSVDSQAWSLTVFFFGEMDTFPKLMISVPSGLKYCL